MESSYYTGSVKVTYPDPLSFFGDRIIILAALQEVLKRHREQGHPLADVVVDKIAHEWLLRLLRESSVVACRSGPDLIGIICYSIEPFDLGTCQCLTEHLVLATDDSAGFGRVAVEILEKIAKEQHCKMIVSGNALSLNQKLTENLYTRKGSFLFSHQNFIKVLS
jgi:hypothetical protein